MSNKKASYQDVLNFMQDKGRNVPLSDTIVQALPEGFYQSTVYPNRKARRQAIKSLKNQSTK